MEEDNKLERNNHFCRILFVARNLPSESSHAKLLRMLDRRDSLLTGGSSLTRFLRQVFQTARSE